MSYYIKSLIKISIGCMPGFYEDEFEVLIDDNTKVAYIGLSKCANSAIKNCILAIYSDDKLYGGLSVHHIDIKKINKNLEIFNTRSVTKMVKKLDGYATFTICRNPYERLISCWVDHINSKNIMFCRSPIIRKLMGFDSKNISLSDFVKAVGRVPDSYSDRHFRSQTSSTFTLSGKPIADVVLHMEGMSDMWNNTELLSPYPSPKKVNVNKYDGEILLTDELKEIIYSRYENDFINFGYHK